MDNDDIDQYAGLFRVPSKTSGGMFCWPVDITIDSMPRPVYMRVVTYSIRSVSDGDQPQPANLADETYGDRYVSSKGQKTFTFTINSKPHSIREVVNLIRQHFFEEVLRGNRVRDHENAIDRMIAIKPKSVTVSIEGIPVKASNIRHRSSVSYDIDIGLHYGTQTLSCDVDTFNEFAKVSKNYCSVDHNYISNDELMTASEEMILSQITIG